MPDNPNPPPSPFAGLTFAVTTGEPLPLVEYTTTMHTPWDPNGPAVDEVKGWEFWLKTYPKGEAPPQIPEEQLVDPPKRKRRRKAKEAKE